MREQNAYLSIAGFLQLLVMASGGAFVNEVLKDYGDHWLLVTYFLVLIATLMCAVWIYAKFFRKHKS